MTTFGRKEPWRSGGLTLRQDKILAFIHKHTQRVGFPPTLREIAETFRFASTHAVSTVIEVLIRRGFLAKVPKTARGLVVTAQPIHWGAFREDWP